MKRIGMIGMMGLLLATSALATTTLKEKEPPMYKLDYEITIGAYRVQALDQVTIETSQELLSDQCRISLPGMVAGRAVQVEDRIKRGDPVTVRLGYNGDLRTEFSGYLRAIYPDNPMVLECEDSVFLFRKTIRPKVLKNVTVAGILNYVLAEVNPQLAAPFRLVTDLAGADYKWESFAIQNATGYEVLDKLRKESGLLIYARGQELHYHLAYTQKAGQVIYDFGINIETTNDLKYVSAADQKVQLTVVGRTPKGAKLEVEVGESGGDAITLQRPTISDKSTLEKIAREELKKRTYDGYRGEIQGWLVPYCSTGYTAVIRDEEYPARQGSYYVVGAKVEFGQKGGVRTVELGAKLS